MYPHERSLVAKLKDKPFVLIGINSDPRETAKEAIKEENLTWRSFWDGGSTRGPIASAWRITGWPTLYVVDHDGVIRHKYIGSPGDKVLDDAIETLVAKVEKPKSTTNK